MSDFDSEAWLRKRTGPDPEAKTNLSSRDEKAMRWALAEIYRFKNVLRKHHQWHLDIGTVLFPDDSGDGHHGSPVEVNLTDSYSDSTLCEETLEALK
jgi:hypothetical protein